MRNPAARGRHRIEERVCEPAQIQAAVVRKKVGQVLDEMEVRRKPEAEGRIEVAAALRRRHDKVVDRQQGIDQKKEETPVLTDARD